MLVAVDIGQAIADFAPHAKVIIARCAAEAGEALKSVKSIDVAFLGVAPCSDRGRHLAVAVRRLGGRLVFIGDEAEDQGPWSDGMVLDRPFDTDAVLVAIKGVPKARTVAADRPFDMAYPSTRHFPSGTHEFFGMGTVVPQAVEAMDFATANLREAFEN